MDLATLGIRIDSNGVVKATGDLKGMEGQAKRSEDSIDGLSRAFRMLAPLVGTVMAAFSIRALTGYADAWSDMQSRVGAAVKNMEAAPALMERLVDVANASYSPLAQTVEIYGRNVAVLRDLGRGAVEAADFTEALNHALVTTATKGQDADVVLNALSRAISTGKLRAMEYETIMSRSPRVLEAVADAMGTTVTGLRQMAVDGKVTGGVIVDALIGSLEELREEAGEMPATIGDAFVRIQTNFGALVGRVDQATGASENFAITLIGLADSIRNMTDDVVRSAVVIQTIFGSALDGVTGLVASLGIEFDGMATLIIAGAGAAGFAVTTFGFITLRTLSAIGAALMMNPFALLIGGIAAVVAASYIFRDEIAKLIGFDVFGVFKDVANDIIGLFVGAYQAVVAVWNELPGEFESIGKLAWNALLGALSGPVINWTPPWGGETITLLDLDLSNFEYQLTTAEQNVADLAASVFDTAQGVNYLGEAGQGIRDLWDNALGAQAALADLAGGGGGGSDPLGLGGAAGKLNAYQEAVKSVREGIQTLEQQALAFGLSETAATRFNTAMDLLKAAQEAGIPITEGLIDEINEYADALALADERVRVFANADAQAKQLAQTIQSTLGKTLKDIFSGGIEDVHDFFEAIAKGFDGLAAQNFNALFGFLTPDDKINQTQDMVKKAVSAGVFEGFDKWFGEMTGQDGTGAGGAMLGAALGGFSTGYQAADPVMGGLGGALQGAGAGMAFGPAGMAIGAVIGGIAGLVGGLMGMNKKLEEARQKLDSVSGSIENLIAIGEGIGVGSLQAERREYRDKSFEYQTLARDAQDWETYNRLQAAYDRFIWIQHERWVDAFDGMRSALEEGQGLDSAFMQGASQMRELGEALKGLVQDAAFLDRNVRETELAVTSMALAFLGGARELTATEQSAERLNGIAATLARTLVELGANATDAARAVDAELNRALETLRSKVVLDVSRAMNENLGFGWINELLDAQDSYLDRLRDVSAAGLDASLANNELHWSLVSIARQAELTDEQLMAAAAAFPSLSDAILGIVGMDRASTDLGAAKAAAQQAEAALRSAYEAEARTIEKLISRHKQLTKTLGEFINAMRLDSSLSPLGPYERMVEAQRQFQEVASLALTGDEDALDRLTDASRSYLDEAKSYYASSTTYFKIFEEVEGILNKALAYSQDQLSEAELQLSALRQQIDSLISIDDSVKSVADAIADLDAARIAADAAQLVHEQHQAALLEQILAALQMQQSASSLHDPARGLLYLQNNPDVSAAVASGAYGTPGTSASDKALEHWLAHGQYEGVGRVGYAAGGLVHGPGTGTSDSIRAMLSAGEYVMPASRVTPKTLPVLDNMRAGRSDNDNSSASILAELQALREEVARNTGVTQAGAQMQVEAAHGTTGAVQSQTAEIRRAAGERRR